MKSRQVTQYICEFCNKRLLRKFSMAEHEKICTVNPARHCRMCDAMRDIPESVAKLKAHDGFPNDPDLYRYSYDEVDPEFTALVESEAEGCPACALALWRQCGASDHVYYPYAEKAKEFFAERYAEEQMMHNAAYSDIY